MGKGSQPEKSSLDVQAEYARLSALVHLRLVELREALEHHESEHRHWTRARTLMLVESLLGRVVALVMRHPEPRC